MIKRSSSARDTRWSIGTHQFAAAVFPVAEARFPELLEGPGRPSRPSRQQVEDVGWNPAFGLLLRLPDFVAAARVDFDHLNEVATGDPDFVVSHRSVVNEDFDRGADAYHPRQGFEVTLDRFREEFWIEWEAAKKTMFRSKIPNLMACP